MITAIVRRLKAEQVIVLASAVDLAASSLGLLESQTQSQGASSLRGGRSYVGNRALNVVSVIRARYFSPGHGAEDEAWTTNKGRKTNNSASTVDPSKLVVGAGSRDRDRKRTSATSQSDFSSQPPSKRLRSVKMSMPTALHDQIEVHDEE